MRLHVTQRLGLFVVLLLTSFPTAGVALPFSPQQAANRTLREIAAKAGIFVGAATEPDPIRSNPIYAEVLRQEFNSLTPENRMKWRQIHPVPSGYVFAPSDELVAFAEGNGMRVRGHNLLWADPSFLPDYVNATADPGALRALMRDHIQTVVGRYAGRVAQWDVLNEPLSLGGPSLRSNVFLDLLGPNYIAEAFQLAHQADPAAELFLNDFLIEYDIAKFQGLYDLVSGLLADGVPIHGVGFEAHYTFLPVSAGQLQANMQAISDLGLAVEITELDINLDLFSGTLEERRGAQEQAFFDVVSACLAVERCRGITTWGVDDAHSWLNDFLGGNPEPLLFDAALNRKRAYGGFRRALQTVPEPDTAVLLLAALIVLGSSARRPKCLPASPHRVLGHTLSGQGEEFRCEGILSSDRHGTPADGPVARYDFPCWMGSAHPRIPSDSVETTSPPGGVGSTDVRHEDRPRRFPAEDPRPRRAASATLRNSGGLRVTDGRFQSGSANSSESASTRG